MHRSALEGEAKQAGCTIERDGALLVVRDDWTENEDHAARLVATNAVSYAGLGLGQLCGLDPAGDEHALHVIRAVRWLAGELTLPGASRRPRLQ